MFVCVLVQEPLNGLVDALGMSDGRQVARASDLIVSSPRPDAAQDLDHARAARVVLRAATSWIEMLSAASSSGVAPCGSKAPGHSSGTLGIPAATLVRTRWLKAQKWAQAYCPAASPVDEMARTSGIPERTFKRRFTKATGLTLIEYIRHLRIDQAKRHLELTSLPVDENGWQVGYQNPAFFRRLFKRTTGPSPSSYRRQFQLPALAVSKQEE